MRLEAGRTVSVLVTIRNTGREPWAGVYAEVDYGIGRAVSPGVALLPGQSTDVKVRISNPGYSALDIPSATVRIKDARGKIYNEREQSL